MNAASKWSVASGMNWLPSSKTQPRNANVGDGFYNETTGGLEVFTPSGWTPLAGTGASDARVDGMSFPKDKAGRALLQVAFSATDPADLMKICTFFEERPDAAADLVRWIEQQRFVDNLKGIT